MNIKLANRTELTPITVLGSNRYVQGADRDVLSFVFPASEGMDKLDGIFTPTACESITVNDGEGEYIHKGYTVRAELKKEWVEVTPETEEAPAVTEERITVSMGQRTYTEKQLALLAEQYEKMLGGTR